MAQLNLRDRVIETTIAYVGSEGDGGASNLAHVKDDRKSGRAGVLTETVVNGGRLLSLDWRPREGATLNDCDLTVKLVSTSGPVDADVMQDVLVDADGLVLVLEADPEAAPQNERAVAFIREALARDPDRSLPVIVQVNHGGGEAATAAAAAETSTGKTSEDWPRVTACAAKGDGVMETLQRAVNGVVDSMQRASVIEPAAPRPPALRAEGNPLLGALRQVLQQTVTEQMSALETRLVAHLEKQMRTREQAPEEGTRAFQERLGAIDAQMERVESAMAELAQRSTEARERTASRDDVEQAAARAAGEASAASVTMAEALNERLTSLDKWMERIESTVIETSARASAASAQAVSRADVDRIQARVVADASAHREAVLGEIKEYRKTVREEAARAVVSGVQHIQKTLDAVSVETKELNKWAAQQFAADVPGAIKRSAAEAEEARKRVESLLTESSRLVAGQLGELASRITHVDEGVGDHLSDVRDVLRASGDAAEQRATAMQVELTTLTEELRKRNKSWFG